MHKIYLKTLIHRVSSQVESRNQITSGNKERQWMLNIYLFLFVLLVRDYKKGNTVPIVVINRCLQTPSTTGSLVSIDSKYETASENLTEPRETKYCQTPPFGNHGNSRSFFKHSYIPSPFPVPSINRILHGPKIIKTRQDLCQI